MWASITATDVLLYVCLTGIWAVEGTDKEMEEDRGMQRRQKGRRSVRVNEAFKQQSTVLRPESVTDRIITFTCERLSFQKHRDGFVCVVWKLNTL